MQVTIVTQPMELGRKHMLQVAAYELNSRQGFLLACTAVRSIQVGKCDGIGVRVDRLDAAIANRCFTHISAKVLHRILAVAKCLNIDAPI